jgi:predicted nucleic acid-binding protein
VILLDTNVLSELVRPTPSPHVVGWLNRVGMSATFVSAISHAEMLTGALTLPSGKRRDALTQAVDQVFLRVFAGRSWPFDDEAARHYADIVTQRQRAGRPISHEDAQIAAIARHHAAPLATRNIRDFEGIDRLLLINPWTESLRR